MSDIMTDLLKHRTIVINAILDDDKTAAFLEKLYLLEAESNDPIKLMINCNGGHMGAILSFYHVTRTFKSPIYTHCIGYAQSTGAILVALGTPGHRVAARYSSFLLHQLSRGQNGNFDVIVASTKEMKYLYHVLIEILTERTKLTKTQLSRLLKRETYFDAQKALEWGLIDRIE